MVAKVCQQSGAENRRISVMTFRGLQNLPLLAAQANGFFAARGLAVDVSVAPNSAEVLRGIRDGRFQIVHSTADNALTLVDVAKADVPIVIGGDNGFTHLFVQPEISSYAELRGKTILVDAVDTGFTFHILEILRLHGVGSDEIEFKVVGATVNRLNGLLQDKAHAAAMLFAPFATIAQRAGLRDLGPAVKVAGPYQSTVGYVLRSWATANAENLDQYLAAYIEGQRWAMAPKNKRAAIALYAGWLEVADDIALACYDEFQSCAAADAAIDLAGLENVLAMRARHLRRAMQAPRSYLDLTYYGRALSELSRQPSG